MVTKRSLYQCFHARVRGDEICCAKGRNLSRASNSGAIGTVRLMRGEPLELTVCQNCEDYDEMGPPVLKEDRG